jgi:restriction endonuclease Mrr
MWTAIFALALTFMVPPSFALGQGGNLDKTNPAYSEAPSTINPDTIDEATLKHAATAYVKVKRIVQKREQALSGAGDAAEKEQIAQRAESREKAAVEAEGLQPQQYNQIIQLAQADKAFQRKFLSQVKKVEN